LVGLLGAAVQAYVAVDFQSWFVQLTPSRAIARRFFAAAGSAGRHYRLTGIPMGFTWAPVVAHAVTTWLGRRVVARATAAGLSIRTSAAYIDNLIFAVADPAHAPPLVALIRRVAAEVGAVIKPSSVEVGATVEWRGLSLSAISHTAWLKPAFVGKVDGAIAALCARRGTAPLLELVAAASCLLYASYVRAWPFARLHTTLDWLSRVTSGLSTDSAPTASTPAVPTVDWQRVQTLPRVLLAEWSHVWAALQTAFAPGLSPVRPPGAPRAIGVSDAALAPGRRTTRAWAFHSPVEMRLEVRLAESAVIAVEELHAMADGLRCLNATRPAGATWWTTWRGDNMCALQATLRSWSPHPELNPLVDSIWSGQQPASLALAYQTTRSIIMDAYTRDDAVHLLPGGRPFTRCGPPCAQHPGTYCPEFVAWLTSLAPSTDFSGRVGAPRVTYLLRRRRDTRAFFAHQPAAAMSAANAQATPSSPVPSLGLSSGAPVRRTAPA